VPQHHHIAIVDNYNDNDDDVDDVDVIFDLLQRFIYDWQVPAHFGEDCCWRAIFVRAIEEYKRDNDPKKNNLQHTTAIATGNRQTTREQSRSETVRQ
jgi:cation transport regulator ChaB